MLSNTTMTQSNYPLPSLYAVRYDIFVEFCRHSGSIGTRCSPHSGPKHTSTTTSTHVVCWGEISIFIGFQYEGLTLIFNSPSKCSINDGHASNWQRCRWTCVSIEISVLLCWSVVHISPVFLALPVPLRMCCDCLVLRHSGWVCMY